MNSKVIGKFYKAMGALERAAGALQDIYDEDEWGDEGESDEVHDALAQDYDDALCRIEGAIELLDGVAQGMNEADE